ncbi:MAG: HD domain-containing protein [Clostridia bacterium]|nr:HD domain-containing protein [Clostridia bacterium]
MNRIEKVREKVDDILLHMTDSQERRCAYVHLYGVAQACALLAVRRGVEAELAVIAGMLHDLHAYAAMDARDHAPKSAEMARTLLQELDWFREDEIAAVCTAIARHSDKQTVHGPLDEVLKDADVMQHMLYDPLQEGGDSQKSRRARLKEELGVHGVLLS